MPALCRGARCWPGSFRRVPGPGHPPAQHGELVPQHRDLHIVRIRSPTAADHTENSPYVGVGAVQAGRHSGSLEGNACVGNRIAARLSRSSRSIASVGRSFSLGVLSLTSL
jgi:hypothetical protein